jgi:pilus assembly protein CpaF
VVEIIAPDGTVTDGLVDATTLFTLGPDGLRATGDLPVRMAAFERAGIDTGALVRATAPVPREPVRLREPVRWESVL